MPKFRLALEGGGARLFAHVAALEAVRDLGMDISVVAGVSAGAATKFFLLLLDPTKFRDGENADEITFLVRPAVLEDEVDVRKFFTFDRDGQLKAFAFFDPVYEGGEVVGYLCSTRRRLPETDPLVGYAQMRYAMESFQQEGKRYLFLGLSPLANIEDKEFTYNWLVRCIFRFAYANALVNRFLYPVQQLTKHKRAFGGTVAKSYYAFNRNPSLPRLIKVLRACTPI